MEYYNEIRGRLNHRTGGFDYIFDYLQKISNPVIVETGCVRDVNNLFGDGHSSILFDRFIGEHGGEFFTVDSSEANCLICREQMTSVNSRVVLSGSVSYLHELNSSLKSSGKQIDLLYLDSMDASFTDETLTNKSALYHLYELLSILPSLRVGGLICVDDNWLETKKLMIMNDFEGLDQTHIKLLGKGRYIAEYMEFLGHAPCYAGYQLIWRWR